MKTIQVSAEVIKHCAVKAERAEKLTLEEVESLINWCNCQDGNLWEDMALQEILNVYRASAEWDTWEGWASEDWRAAYDAWNGAVIDEGNKMRPRE